MTDTAYDIVIVGAGIAGCALAHALATTTTSPTPFKICVLERSLATPDRIVGELLQPGGVRALEELEMEDCLEGIDAIPVYGYAVVKDGATVHIPYPDAREGRSFHHGRFIDNLRGKVRKLAQEGKLDLVEATANELVYDDEEEEGRVVGVRATRKNGAATPSNDSPSASTSATPNTTIETFRASLVVIADGCFSNFRSQVLSASARKPVTKSHFCGAILKDVKLPIPNCGTVCLVRNSGPVLLYQISERDTRMLVDVKTPLPSDLKTHIETHVAPQLPPSLQPAVYAALASDRLRRMPNSFLPGAHQTRPGAILIGDAWNMRHPLTGGGMTVALHDCLRVAQSLGALGPEGVADWKKVTKARNRWEWERKSVSATVNILSVALYDLFGAEDDNLEVLRTGCFKYFERGGECVNGPVSLLSAIQPSFSLLFYHFFSVAFYSIWCMFTHGQVVTVSEEEYANGDVNGEVDANEDVGEKKANGNGQHKVEVNGGVIGKRQKLLPPPSALDYPFLLVKASQVFWTACVVFGPLMWSELW